MKNILYFYYDCKNSCTMLTDAEGKCEKVNETAINLLKRVCRQYGSSYQGAKESFSYLTGAKRKIPICVSAVYRMIFIPLYSEKNEKCLYIQYDKIKKVVRTDKGCRVYFKGGYLLDISCDARRIIYQMKRCQLYLELIFNPEENLYLKKEDRV